MSDGGRRLVGCRDTLKRYSHLGASPSSPGCYRTAGILGTIASQTVRTTVVASRSSSGLPTDGSALCSGSGVGADDGFSSAVTAAIGNGGAARTGSTEALGSEVGFAAGFCERFGATAAAIGSRQSASPRASDRFDGLGGAADVASPAVRRWCCHSRDSCGKRFHPEESRRRPR